jgi:hypothetical protein
MRLDASVDHRVAPCSNGEVSGWDRECAASIDLDIESSHGRLIARRPCRDRLGLRHLALDLREAKVGNHKGASRSPPSLLTRLRRIRDDCDYYALTLQLGRRGNIV